MRRLLAEGRGLEKKTGGIIAQIHQLEGLGRKQHIALEREHREADVQEQLHDQAIEFYKKAIGLNPDYGDAWMNLGDAYRSKGIWREDVSSYQKELSLDSETVLNHCNTGTCDADMGKND